MDLSAREDLIKNCVAKLIAAHHDYAHSAVEHLDQAHPFWKAADLLVAACDPQIGHIPQACHRIFISVWGDGCSAKASKEGVSACGFKAAWQDYKRQQLAALKPTWQPGQTLWSRYSKLKEAASREVGGRVRELETVAELFEQKVTPEQIARIYDWVTPSGTPDVQRVWRAKADPARHNGPETRVPGLVKEQQRTVQWERVAQGLAADPQVAQIRAELERGIDPDVEVPDAPRSRDERHDDLLPDLDFIGAAEPDPALPVGVDFGNRAGPTFHVPEPPADREPNLPEAPADEDAPTIEERILDMVDRGLPDAEILQATGATRQKLTAVKKRADEVRQTAGASA